MRVLSLLLLSLFATNNYAASLDCGLATLNTVYVQSSRTDGGFHANKLLIWMGPDKLPACADITFGYLDNTDAAYSGVLSMAIAAFTTGKRLRVVVNDGPIQDRARKIEWVNF